MAKFINKMKDLMFGEYEDDEDYYEDDYEYEAPAREAAPVSNNYGLRDVSRESDYSTTSAPRKTTRNNPQVYSINTNVQMQVVIIKPECYEDAQRIMDFLSGTCYSLEGSIQRVANNIFVIAPENVDISGDFKEELKTKGVILPWMSSGR